MSTDDWQSRIKPLEDDIYAPHEVRHERWKIEDGLRNFRVEKDAEGKFPPIGTLLFARRRRRKLRTRYVVMQVTSAWGSARPTNAEVVYRKSKRRWVVYIDGQPINDGYTTLLSCKTSFLKHPLDRLAAEAVK